MKNLISVMVLTLVCFSANAANNGRPAMTGKTIIAAPRYTASINQLGTMKIAAENTTTATQPAIAVVAEEVKPAEKIDMREEERDACVNNNIGVGNTFVWASRYSDTSNYANMIEDVKKPENNVCFVKVELKSSDESRISVADINPKYFMWGEAIECGSWVNEKEMEKRILDARKGARIGGIVASTVGGVGLGVGAMELFGNKLIDGKVQGQKSKKMTKEQLYRSQLLVYKDSNQSLYNKYVKDLTTLKKAHQAGSINADDYAKYEILVNEFAN